MTEQTNAGLIARLQAVRDDGYLSATYLGDEHVGDLVRDAIDALEAAERVKNDALRLTTTLTSDLNAAEQRADREPSEAEVEAAAEALAEQDDPGVYERGDVVEHWDDYVIEARAALLAAQEVRNRGA